VVLAGLRDVAERKNAAAAEAAGEPPPEPGASRIEGRKLTVESVEAELGHREDPDR
jgi:hypothetical protein